MILLVANVAKAEELIQGKRLSRGHDQQRNKKGTQKSFTRSF